MKNKPVKNIESSKELKHPAHTPSSGAGRQLKVRWWFYLVALLIPVVLLIVLETGLRLFNYGRLYVQWVQIDDNSYILNPDIARRYFYTTVNVPYSNQSLFDKIKLPNAFRVFILGESSAAGYPYLPNGSFAKYLKQRLGLIYPDRRIEIVNISMTAINTYALRDMMPGIIEQKPDLVLIYTGHNEYYGALGAGSMESLGSSRTMVNFMLSLNKFKTVELFRNIIKSVFASTSGGNKPVKLNDAGNKTMMARMAKEQTIAYNSDTYKKGLDQYEGNMRDILQMAKDANVPVILGTLACNLKDQSPFISTTEGSLKPADKVYKEAMEEYNRGNYAQAKKLFIMAKDLDGLRFRAPEDINRITKQLAREFSFPVTDIDSAFNADSPHGITGDNLMTDHLHPTIQGYQLIGRLFFESMKANHLLPAEPDRKYSDEQQDSWVKNNFYFSPLDSVIGRYRITVLKNDWPYIKSASQKKPIMPVTYIDTLAYNVVVNNAAWEEAHRKAASYYINHDDYAMFEKEIDILIDQFPFIDDYAESGANFLLNEKQYNRSLKYFYMIDAKKPEAAAAKWIGIINLSNGNIDEAEKYLLKSISMNSSDSQVYYNMAGVYFNRKDYRKAVDMLDKCLSISPSFPAARAFRTQLLGLIRK